MKLPRIEEVQGLNVAPGDPLCTIEEFMPGECVYVDDMGIVRAACIGVVELDSSLRRIRVRPAQLKPRMPARGEQVYAAVVSIPRDDLALLRIFADERGLPYSGFFTGVLHVTQASDTPVKTMYELMKPGDVVKASVTSSSTPYMLSTKRAQDGVVLAYCSVCGAPLYKAQGESILFCIKCGSIEKRKIAPNYILVHRKRRE